MFMQALADGWWIQDIKLQKSRIIAYYYRTDSIDGGPVIYGRSAFGVRFAYNLKWVILAVYKTPDAKFGLFLRKYINIFEEI